jgi:hypothetical protein
VAAVGKLRQGVGEGFLQQALVGDCKLVGRAHDAAAFALDFFAQQQHPRCGIEADAQGLDTQRFDEHVVGTGIDGFENQPLASRRRQQQRVALLARRGLAQQAAESCRFQTRHGHVGNHDLGRLAQGLLQSFGLCCRPAG